MTYGELAELVSEFARQLRGAGLAPGDALATALPNGPEFAIAQLGGMSAALTVVALPHDAQHEEALFCLHDVGARALCVSRDGLERGHRLAAEADACAFLLTVRRGSMPTEVIAVGRPAKRAQELGGDQTRSASCLVYTSNGRRPLAVRLTGRQVAQRAEEAMFLADLQPHETVVSTAPNHGPGGLTLGLHAPLLAGAGVKLLPWTSPAGTAAAIAESRAGAWVCVASQLFAFLQSASDVEMPTHLRRVILVGAPLSEMGMQTAQERLGVTIAHLAGDAETFPLARGGLEPAADAGAAMMAWRCPDRIDVEVRDQDGELAQPGEIGDLHVGGPTIANGFWNRPESSRGRRMPREMWLTAYRGSADAHATLHHLSLEPGRAVHRDEDVCGLNEVHESLYSHPGVLEVFLLAVRNEYGLPVVWACFDLQGLRHVQLEPSRVGQMLAEATAEQSIAIEHVCTFGAFPRTLTGRVNLGRMQEFLERAGDQLPGVYSEEELATAPAPVARDQTGHATPVLSEARTQVAQTLGSVGGAWRWFPPEPGQACLEGAFKRASQAFDFLQQGQLLRARSRTYLSILGYRRLVARPQLAGQISNMGGIYFRLGDSKLAGAYAWEAREIFETMGDRKRLAETMANLELVAGARGSGDRDELTARPSSKPEFLAPSWAIDQHEEAAIRDSLDFYLAALQRSDATNDAGRSAWLLRFVVMGYASLGDLDSAEAYWGRLHREEAAREFSWAYRGLLALAELARSKGRQDHAEALYRRLCSEPAAGSHRARAMEALARLAHERGDLSDEGECLINARRFYHEYGMERDSLRVGDAFLAWQRRSHIR